MLQCISRSARRDLLLALRAVGKKVTVHAHLTKAEAAAKKVAQQFGRDHQLAVRDMGDELAFGAQGCTDWRDAPVVKLHTTPAPITTQLARLPRLQPPPAPRRTPTRTPNHPSKRPTQHRSTAREPFLGPRPPPSPPQYTPWQPQPDSWTPPRWTQPGPPTPHYPTHYQQPPAWVEWE